MNHVTIYTKKELIRGFLIVLTNDILPAMSYSVVTGYMFRVSCLCIVQSANLKKQKS